MTTESFIDIVQRSAKRVACPRAHAGIRCSAVWIALWALSRDEERTDAGGLAPSRSRGRRGQRPTGRRGLESLGRDGLLTPALVRRLVLHALADDYRVGLLPGLLGRLVGDRPHDRPWIAASNLDQRRRADGLEQACQWSSQERAPEAKQLGAGDQCHQGGCRMDADRLDRKSRAQDVALDHV